MANVLLHVWDMAIVSRAIKNGDEEMNHYRLSFTHRILITVLSLFLLFATFFIFYQYQREKEYKIELLNLKLQYFNLQIADQVGDSLQNVEPILKSFLPKLNRSNLRVTLISPRGKVFYDNERKDYNHFVNHLSRVEVKQALLYGSGFDVRRKSETIGLNFFYAATYYNHRYIVRCALPYNNSLANILHVNFNFIWISGGILLVLIIVLWLFTTRIATSITQLRKFAYAVDQNKVIDLTPSFPNNELGEISDHIVGMYKRLHETKEELSVEREKLITHLQISHEGLGIFTPQKKAILVNDLFLRFCDFISDTGISAHEDVLRIPEFTAINDFINENILIASSRSGEHRKSINIVKNGRSFSTECVLFQDQSFEISINDNTELETQASLKRQLTQNIAHELKTPVSSIQGYLETIENNKDLSSETLYAFIHRCYFQCNRLSSLLKDISVLTRIDEAPEMISKENINVYTIVKTVEEDVALQLKEKQILFRNQLSKTIPLSGNLSLIYSIFRNLTDNVIAYAGLGVTITVKCYREDNNYYYFSFSDTGVGVPEESLIHLFKRFYRIDKGRSRKMGGTGLGLAIVKNAIVLHGGNISAKNLPTGGLEFLFTLNKSLINN